MAPVHAADAAGREEADAGQRGRANAGCHSRRSDRAMHDRGCDVARADLDRPARDALEIGVRESQAQLAVEDRHRRGHGARLADRGLAAACGAQVVRWRQALADDRRLQRDHRPARVERGGDLG